MVDYSKLSDFEVNRAVALIVNPALAEKECYDISGRAVFHDKGGTCGFSFISDPADAWPIISDNRISLMYDKSTEKGNEAQWCLASSPCDKYIVDYVSESKLLRAAMIVFLMMQDVKNG